MIWHYLNNLRLQFLISAEQRSLAGYSPWGRKEWDTTEQQTLNHSGFGARVSSALKGELEQVFLNLHMIGITWR